MSTKGMPLPRFASFLALFLFLHQAQAGDDSVDLRVPQGLAEATFAGGCFWSVESNFDHVKGVMRTISGYTGGTLENPSYEQISGGRTGHREAERIIFDPRQISYQQLVDTFFRTIDPTQATGQFCDIGDEYRTAIFVHSSEQRAITEAEKKKAAAVLGKTVVTEIRDAGPFYPAESYHQNYHEKNPVAYGLYRRGCGRDPALEAVWKGKVWPVGTEGPK